MPFMSNNSVYIGHVFGAVLLSTGVAERVDGSDSAEQ